ncbi:MAG: hypothetical protein K2K51_00400, partial [Bacteroidales bacterium]|nr:hypothetical protein [Bacteroidales bacterium]
LFWGYAQDVVEPEETVAADTSVIAIDSVYKDGVRHIVSTDFEIYRLWTTDAAFNLSYADVPGDTTPYRLNIAFNEGRFTMSPGKNKLILKLKKVKAPMELYDTRLIKLGQDDYVTEETKDGTYYYITPAFAISEAQIQQLAGSKVVKFRLVHDKGKFDREDRDNVIPSGLNAAYEAIQQLLAADSSVMDAVVPLEAEPVVAVVEDETPAVWVVPEEDTVTYYQAEENTDGEVVAEEAAVTAQAEVETEAVEETVAEETVEVEETIVEEIAVEETTEAVTESETAVEEQPAETEVETTDAATETGMEEAEAVPEE